LGKYTTEEEIDRFAEALQTVVDEIRQHAERGALRA
jgi:cysteine sulfinate desulfinase/cysteine desulfurase-like protein